MLEKSSVTEFVVPMEDTVASHINATLGNDYMHLFLLNGECVELSKHDFFDAFQIITCADFQRICSAHNMLIRSRATAENRRQELMVNMTPDSVEAYGIAMIRVGKWIEAIEHAKDDIIAIMGWNAWVNACRLYECLYRIPREEL